MYDGVVRLPYQRLHPRQGNTAKQRVSYALGITGWLLFLVAGVYALSKSKSLDESSNQQTSSILSPTSVNESDDTRGNQSTLSPTSSPPPLDLQIKRLALSLDCPELEDAFNQAPPGSVKPFASFVIANGDNCAYVAVHLTKLYLPPGSFATLRAVEGRGMSDKTVRLSDHFPSDTLFSNVLTPPILGKEIRLELHRESHSVDTNGSDAQCFGLEADSYFYKLLSAVSPA